MVCWWRFPPCLLSLGADAVIAMQILLDAFSRLLVPGGCIEITWGVSKTTNTCFHLQGFWFHWSRTLLCVFHCPSACWPGSPFSCSSEEAVATCCSPLHLLLASQLFQGLRNQFFAWYSLCYKSSFSFPCAGSPGTLIKTAGSEDRESELHAVGGSLGQPGLGQLGEQEQLSKWRGRSWEGAGIVAVSRGLSSSSRDTMTQMTQILMGEFNDMS